MANEKQKKHLRGLAHALKPVVMVGDQGLKSSVMTAIEEALQRHELIKVKIKAGERSERDETIVVICEQTGCELIQRVGFVATLYRRNEDKAVIALPR